MKTSIVAGSLLVALSLVAPLQGSRWQPTWSVRSGPVAGRVVVGEGYSTYRRPVVYRQVPAARDRGRAGVRASSALNKHWRQQGFRPVVVYYRDGRYYDRYLRGGPVMREVVVYERNGRFYHECDERDRDDRYDGPRYDDGRDWND